MSKEFIFELDYALYNEETGEAVFKPKVVCELVRCGECKHCFVDGDNVRFNVCELTHNRVQSDDWFCADGERKSND